MHEKGLAGDVEQRLRCSRYEAPETRTQAACEDADRGEGLVDGRGLPTHLCLTGSIGFRRLSVSLIFSRAPLRISLGGGGTDLPSYYRDHGGFVVAGAIDKYVYVMIHTLFQQRYTLKYSQLEEADDVGAIRHPLLREGLSRHWRGGPLEIATIADAQAGTGMGSSGAFTVALLRGLAHAGRRTVTAKALAEAACEIEIDILREAVGKQDPYVAAHGGISAYTFHPNGSVDVEPLELATGTLNLLREHLLLFYTGDSRSASAVLADQDQRTHAGDARMLDNLHRIKEIGVRSRDLLLAGDLAAYAALMDEHWQAKRSRSPGISTSRTDELYTLARRSGAIGGKLVGAGGGGFLLVYASNPSDTRQAMSAAGSQELLFDFEFTGAYASDRI
jgi:D-glycero-alpha-D-manno-heptose-7-phosphate kinase